MKTCFLVLFISVLVATLSSQTLPLDRWTYIQVDSTRPLNGSLNKTWLRAFGLGFGDANADGFQDIVSGRCLHLNPGGDMTGVWRRVDFNLDLDALLFVNVDNDEFADIIAVQLPSVFWLEATNREGTAWNMTHVAYLPPTGHQNGQGYVVADLIAGGKPEILLACGDGVHYLQIPDDPRAGLWPSVRIAGGEQIMDEGIGVGDFDGDGDLDIAVGSESSGAFAIFRYENPDDGSADWPAHLISTETQVPDRLVAADLNGDGRPDLAVSEERYPGLEPNASLYWFENPGKKQSDAWKRHTLITTWSLNNLDAGDLNGDGDIDPVTNEHKGSDHHTYLFENDGKGNFIKHVIDSGKEMHLGARLCDLDGDGDLDLVGTGWDHFQFMHLWRNDAVHK